MALKLAVSRSRPPVPYGAKYYNECDLGGWRAHAQLEGTWQVLVRSTFRESSTLPSTIKFTPEHDGTVRLVRVRSTRSVRVRSHRMRCIAVRCVAVRCVALRWGAGVLRQKRRNRTASGENEPQRLRSHSYGVIIV